MSMKDVWYGIVLYIIPLVLLALYWYYAVYRVFLWAWSSASIIHVIILVIVGFILLGIGIWLIAFWLMMISSD
ncbi:MAG: hypothetical protein QXL94_04390 [Candidatus Parvarchaeum sp.]